MKYLFTILTLIIIHLTSLTAGGMIVDSNMTLEQAMKGVNPNCPEWILQNQALIEVYYYGFDGQIHKGQLVADFRLVEDLQAIFKVAFDNKFPVKHVKPICVYNWDDFVSMRADNSSAFNYRTVPFAKSLSKHAYGWAIDINTVENPYYTKGKVYPEGASYNTKKPGTLYAKHPVVKEFLKRGWRWGGHWKNKDYQHFDKKLSQEPAKGNKKNYAWPWK